MRLCRMCRLLPSLSTDEIMENHSLDPEMAQDMEDVWVFGYGSILWYPGFSYVSRRIGFIDGYLRRFWQGSTTHRGTPQSPGRVATLVQHSGSRTWGMAFHVVGSEMVKACLERLGLRECHLGGYNLHNVTFTDTHCSQPERLKALVFIASPGNHLYLGPASVDDLACQVVKCGGVSGSNAEYVTRLADFVRHHIPHDDDHELFELDARVRRLLTSSDRIVDGLRERPPTLASSSAGFGHWDVTDRDISAQRRNNVAVTVRAG